MSYYFVIVGTRDNPLYQADLQSKPTGSASTAASFFSSSSSNTAANTASTPTSAAKKDQSAAGISSSADGGGVFGFGNALGTFTGAGGAAAAANPGAGATPVRTGSDGRAAASSSGLGFGRYNDKHVLQMIAHSSLDVIEDRQFSLTSGGAGLGGPAGIVNSVAGGTSTQAPMYLKSIDRINEWTTSAFLCPGQIKFLLLHEHKHDDGIRNFFFDVWEVLVKVMMNPFHELNAPITSSAFDAKVKGSARKHL